MLPRKKTPFQLDGVIIRAQYITPKLEQFWWIVAKLAGVLKNWRFKCSLTITPATVERIHKKLRLLLIAQLFSSSCISINDESPLVILG